LVIKGHISLLSWCPLLPQPPQCPSQSVSRIYRVFWQELNVFFRCNHFKIRVVFCLLGCKVAQLVALSFRSFANDDRHVMAKHASVYPAPEELEAVQTLVSTVEGALKKVSDWMDGLNKPSGKTPGAASVLCGVTRVGLVAKGLLIKGDMDLELVLMCREKPTKLLLYTVSANLPLQIQVGQPSHSTSKTRL
uniref:DZF domain-containing protein n=1 Tax=Stegastes partitus TaxID=144197 RepID=A0A3B4ZBN9_9TELE